MVTVRVCSKLKTNEVGKSSRYFLGVVNKPIIPLALVGYEMSIANLALTRTRNCLSLQISQVLNKKLNFLFLFCFFFSYVNVP